MKITVIISEKDAKHILDCINDECKIKWKIFRKIKKRIEVPDGS